MLTKDRLLSGNRVRIRVRRESRQLGYDPVPDNTVAIYNRHVEINGRELAELVLESGAHLRISYSHLVEIIRLDYDFHRELILEKAIVENT